MILQTVLKITQTTSFDTINARSTANHLQCSTRPISTCYQSMKELKIDFLLFAHEYYKQPATSYGHSEDAGPYFPLPLSYTAFAQEEAHLFKLLFIHDTDLNMTKVGDFYREIDNEKRARTFSETTDTESERARVIFLDLFFYTHGIAVLAAMKKFTLNRVGAEVMVQNTLTTFTKQEKPGWDLSL